MTVEEYIQLKVFARQDGALLALLWVGCFACYVIGMNSPTFSMFAVLLLFLTPFFVAFRLRNFRDYGREGVISFKRGWGFVVLVFFYASVLFAIVQYAYFAYLDQGFLLDSFSKILDSDEAQQMLTQYNMKDEMSQSLREIQEMRPIDLSLNVMTTNVLLGMLLGLPIAALMQRKTKRIDS